MTVNSDKLSILYDLARNDICLTYFSMFMD